MSRPSRPPGFDMSYRPERVNFMPPWSARLPATLYFGFATVVGLGVIVARFLPSSTWLYRVVVIGDNHRVLTSQGCAALLFASALAALVRQQMAGVVVRPDGIETREVLPLGIPRLRRWTWAQIDRVGIPAVSSDGIKTGVLGAPRKKIRLDLWNGRQEYLPDVEKKTDLAVMIERVALARAIPIEGGTGVLDELGSPFDEEA
ncbi:MAG: hypothetical protein U0271_29770 [Polyangiaceae bacterium]